MPAFELSLNGTIIKGKEAGMEQYLSLSITYVKNITEKIAIKEKISKGA
jgi:hypothetical protein